ncbi:MAG TPA: ankyrin repeat domain-containing protein [Chthoniobacterales bacterium]|jgi:ankyrin repeat protein|nr:ankyrin repeat domain-containing protein [Chthoniobacterales bacterium]
MRFLPTIRTFLGTLAAAVILAGIIARVDSGPAPYDADLTLSPTADSTLMAGPAIGDQPLPALPLRWGNLVDNCFNTDTDLNVPVLRQDNPVVAAALHQDWDIVRKLIEAGAAVESADDTGLTALMVAAKQGNLEMLRMLIDKQARINFMDFDGRTAIHYAMSAGRNEVVDLLLSLTPRLDPASAAARDLLAAAMASGDMRIFNAILERFPPTLEWTPNTRRALETALVKGLKDQVRLLLSKHPAPPTYEGGTAPLIAWAIANEDTPLFETLLACGADPNTVIPPTAEKDFMALLKSKYLRLYVQGETGVNVLMLAAGLGKTDYVRALLDAGADRNRSTPRYRMLPLYFAAWTENWQCVQMLLGGGPMPEELRVEISLAKQHANVIKDGVTIFTTKVSTGRDGYNTKPGFYVITDKDRDHRSTIYKCPMPYFMRLSCRDFGLHEGVVQPYPASHGCIRLPGDAAKKLFVDLPIGTVVSIN